MRTIGALFLNSSSGVPSSRDPEEIREAAEEKGLAVYTIAPGLDISEIVRGRLARGQRLFLAGGGDGTINHVIQPLVNTDGIFGILPLGTFNHFARDLGIPSDWREALDVAVSGATRSVDVGRANERYFANNISLGLYPKLLEQREKFRAFGKWKAYRHATIWAMRTYPHVGLSFETATRLEAVKTHIFMVAVNAYDLNQRGMIAPRATLDSGRLAVYWMPHMPKFAFVKALARYLRGRISIEDGLRSLQTTQIRVQSPNRIMSLGMDGELFDTKAPLVVTIVPQGLQVRVPKQGTSE